MSGYGSIDVAVLVGKTLVGIEGVDESNIIFTTSNGERYGMYHEQDCCESVGVEDVEGDMDDLLHTPILVAEEVSDDFYEKAHKPQYADSLTWTFYRFATIKGYVTLRWLGESNGYYSEEVTFRKLKDE